MSGHSKFANIKHKKEKNDAAKGKIFTIIGREIAVAVKEGGPDPANNFKLATVIAKAKANNMPNDTIERGIKKAAGDVGNVNYKYVTYEGYGPNGIAIIVDALTDNTNRTAANVRSAFTKGQGNVGTPGCVSFMFDKKGQIIIDKEECDMEADDLMMTALDAGAEDFSEEEDSFEILTDPDTFEEVREALEKAGIPMASADVTMIPQNYVKVTDETALKGLKSQKMVSVTSWMWKTDKRPDFCRKDKEVRGYYGIRKGNDLYTVWLEAEERRTESAPDLSEYDV